MKVIAEEKWSYVLFDDDNGWILTLLIGGVVEIDVSIRLTLDEIKSVESDKTYIIKLVDAVKRHRIDFADREINPPVWPGKQ